MADLGGIYRKGRFRNGEWGKHLRPETKRIANKRWRKVASTYDLVETPARMWPRAIRKKRIKARITQEYNGRFTVTTVKSYRTVRDAQNAINRGNVVKGEIISITKQNAQQQSLPLESSRL